MAGTALHRPTEAERQRIEQIVARHDGERPEGVRRIKVTLGADHAGDPAVYLDMVVGAKLQPTREKIDELNDYMQIVLNDIIGNYEIDYWPYMRTVVEE